MLPEKNSPANHDLRAIARVAILLIALCVQLAAARSFPSRSIHIIVPTSPGGLNDLTSRALARQISESVGQSVIVENRPGVGSMIGMSACARSTPDGHTVCLTTPEPLIYNPLLFTKLPYDPDRDFVPVSLLVRIEGLIVASAAAPFNSFPEMIAHAKAHPGMLNYATWGAGSPPAIYLGWINRQNGTSITAVPYKGAGRAVPATLAGEVHLTYMALGFVIPQIKAGRLKALATASSDKRSPFLPEVPTLSEYNSEPGLNAYFGVWAPSKTPGALVERLSAEFVKALRTPELQKLAVQQTMQAVGSTPEEFAAFLKADKANAARVFETLGIHPTDAPSI